MNEKVFVLHNEYIHRGGEDVCVKNEIDAMRDAGMDVIDGRINSGGFASNVAKTALAPWGSGTEGEYEARLLRERPAILHVHNLHPSFSPRIFKAAGEAGIRTVYTLHNYRPLCLNGLFLTPKNELCTRCAGGNYWHGIWRGCYRGSVGQSAAMAGHLTLARAKDWYDSVDCFIAPSQFLRDKFVSNGFPEKRIHIQGHFLPVLPSEDPDAPEPYILYLGRLSEEKGIRWLLETYKRRQVPLRLLIAGQGPLESLVRGACSETIQYLGYVKGEEKARYLRQATAVVLPSTCYENFPLAMMEANAWGAPMVVSRLGGMAELVETGENGSAFAPGDADDFWKVMEEIVSTRSSLQARKQCQSFARQHFSRHSFLSARMALYQNLLQAR